MAFSLKSLISTPSTTADSVDGFLILSLPNAIEPKIWRIELDKIGTATFEIKQEKNSNIAKLTLNPKKGTAEIIASFETKKDALGALMAASRALNTTTSKPMMSATTTPQKKSHKKVTLEKQNDMPQALNYTDTMNIPSSKNSDTQKWGIALLGAVFVIGLYIYLTSLIPERVTGFETTASPSMSATSPQEATGVPVSADDFLGGL